MNGRVDWNEARRRVEEALEATRSALAPDADGVRRVLEARARALAAPRPPTRLPEEELELITFRLGEGREPLAREPGDTGADGRQPGSDVRAGMRSAVPACWVTHVLRSPRVTPVADCPPAFLGLTQVHGSVVGVFDAAQSLAGTGSESGSWGEGHVIVLGRGRPELGLAVGAVGEIVLLERRALQPLPGGTGRDRGEDSAALVQGVTAGGMVVWRGDVLLDDTRFVIRESSR